MKKHILMVALTVLAAAACSKENLDDQEKETGEIRGIEVRANVSQATKTTIDGVNVLWAKGDQVGFIADESSDVSVDTPYTIKDESDGQQSATITVPVKAEIKDDTHLDFTAYYPFSSETATAEIATEQNGQTGKWGYMSAKFSGTKADLVKSGLTFSHTCAYIDFQLKSSDLAGCPVTKVTLTSLDESKLFTGQYTITADNVLTESQDLNRFNYVSVKDPVASLGSEWQGKIAVVAPVDLSGTKVKIAIYYTKDGAACTQTKVIAGSNLEAGHKITLKLNLDKTDYNVIDFADDALGKALVEAFDSDKCGYLTMAQAAAVTNDQMETFASSNWPKTSVTAFNEFQYFTGVSNTKVFANKTIYEITLPASVNEISNDSKFKTLTKISNTEHITRVGSFAFENNKSLKSINLPSVVRIANNAFYGSTALESVGDTQKLIGVYRNAFRGCSNLKSINLSQLKTAEEDSFAYCGSLESVDLRSLTDAGNNMFQSCAKLTSVGSLRSLSKISDNMFKDCRILPAVSYLTENVGKYAFQNCYLLEISNEQFKVVKTIGQGGFDSCKKIAGEISLPVIESIGSSAFSFSGITAVDLTGAPIAAIGSYAFTRMNALQKITISANVTKIRANAFLYSGNLSEIHLLSTTPATLDADALKISDSSVYGGKIYVPKGYVDTYKAADGWSTYADRIYEEQ